MCYESPSESAPRRKLWPTALLKKEFNQTQFLPHFEKVEKMIADARLQFVHFLQEQHHRLPTLVFFWRLTDVSTQIKHKQTPNVSQCIGKRNYSCDHTEIVNSLIKTHGTRKESYFKLYL